jgi:hypothetical protein
MARDYCPFPADTGRDAEVRGDKTLKVLVFTWRTKPGHQPHPRHKQEPSGLKPVGSC